MLGERLGALRLREALEASWDMERGRALGAFLRVILGLERDFVWTVARKLLRRV